MVRPFCMYQYTSNNGQISLYSSVYGSNLFMIMSCYGADDEQQPKDYKQK